VVQLHSRSHPNEIVDYCLRAIQCGKNCGDLYNAGLSYGPLMWNLQVQGADLSAIEHYAEECLQFSNRYPCPSRPAREAMRAGWIEPMKGNRQLAPMEEKVRKWEEDNHIASAGSYYVHLALVHYYLGEHERAEEALVKVERYLSGLTDNVLKRQWHVFGCSTPSSSTRGGSSTARRSSWRRSTRSSGRSRAGAPSVPC
jgi:hypothetical protein